MDSHSIRDCSIRDHTVVWKAKFCNVKSDFQNAIGAVSYYLWI